ncbi:MAG TPA: hypothetical protein VL984_01745 [Acidimicrobiales bacterium]|nr:hypothetical protein [Acidimicrobiales bacterium]
MLTRLARARSLVVEGDADADADAGAGAGAAPSVAPVRAAVATNRPPAATKDRAGARRRDR